MNPKLRFASFPVLIIVTAAMLPGVGLFAPAAAAGSSSRHVSISDEGSGVRVNIQTRDDGLSLQLEARGDIVFADDDSDIVSMGEGDSFDLTVRQDGHRYRARIDGGEGGLERTWWVDGERRVWDAQAQAWFAQMLPEVMRRSGLNAENRVAHILSDRGVPGVLDEIELVHGDHSRRVYFTHLMHQADPGPDAMRRAVELAGSRMRSDFELGSTLKTMLNEPGLDERAWAAFFEAARSIGSDFEQRQVLVALADRVQFDHELLEAYLETATDIGSDFEMRQALSAVLGTPALDENTLSRLLQVSQQIGSDFEQASLLVQAAPQVEGRAVAAYLEASADIGSDFEQRRALAALTEAVRLSTDQAIQFLDTAGGIGSDFELAELMLQSLPHLPDDPAVRRSFLDTANSKLGSNYERMRVLAALSE